MTHASHSTSPDARHCLSALFGITLLALSSSLPALAEEDADWKLALEPAAAHASRPLPLAHPAALDPAALETLLRGITAGESGFLGRSSQRPVFRVDEASLIAAGVSEILARAAPDQQARFAWFTRRGGTVGQLRKTEAVVFVDSQGRVNLAFTTIDDFPGPDRDFFEFLTLSSQNPFDITRSLMQLSVPEGVEAVPASARRAHPLWVRTTSDKLPTAQPAAESTTPRAAAAPAAQVAPQTTPPATAAPSIPAMPQTEIETQQAVRERLEFLKELYDGGLISEAEYAERRREALDRLDP